MEIAGDSARSGAYLENPLRPEKIGAGEKMRPQISRPGGLRAETSVPRLEIQSGYPMFWRI
ncbi:MAG TPA: hypothetical protein VMT46_18710 [Anaerolineaceae bacterium]|nr:hypothetical protein [Anaerolineaceae bacterium]